MHPCHDNENKSDESDETFITERFHRMKDEDDDDEEDGQSEASASWNKYATNAFGEIRFNNHSTDFNIVRPKYVRLHEKDRMDDVLQLMTNKSYWNLPSPKIIISIQGGASSFKFAKKRISSSFKTGLLDIVNLAGAWIVTPGTRAGVYEMIGSAVEDYKKLHGPEVAKNIVLIGIASWRYITNKEELINRFEWQKFAHRYNVDNGHEDGSQYLDPNHSNFILVDENSLNKFDAVIEWRAKFEHFLSNQGEGSSDEVHIPAVTLLVNGGELSLQSCAQTLTAQPPVPLVAVAGSGRAADVVVALKKLCSAPEIGLDNTYMPTEQQLNSVYEWAMGYLPRVSTRNHLKMICRQHKYICVFDDVKPECVADRPALDRVILSAIVKEGGKAKRMAQLRLAVEWKRVDHARDEILNAKNSDYSDLVNDKEFLSLLHELASEALLKDDPEFVELFMQHGLKFEQFVTGECLKTLYEKSAGRNDACSQFAKGLLKSKSIRKHCCCCCTGACRCHTKPKRAYMLMAEDIFENSLNVTYPKIHSDLTNVFSEQPALDLFLWAVFFNRLDMAKMLWRCTEDHIAVAVTGAAVLRGLKKKCSRTEPNDLAELYRKSTLVVEDWAIGVLDHCWNDKENYSSDILFRSSVSCGGSSVLSMAFKARLKRFEAHTACYTKLKRIWRGDISLVTKWWWIVLFALTWPMPFALWLLKFDDGKDTLKLKLQPKKKDREIGVWDAFCRASWSPIVLCIHYTMFNTAFLFLFSLFVVHELRPLNVNNTAHASIVDGVAKTSDNASVLAKVDTCLTCIPGSIGYLERTVYACVFIIFIEEVRQIYVTKRKILWIRDFWNFVDFLSIGLFIASVIGRIVWAVDWFKHARGLFCSSLFGFVIRFSQIFSLVRRLGPKVLMIKKMMGDLLIFISILLLINFMFGIISRAVLDPELPLDIDLFQKIIRRSYFITFGELALEEFYGGDQDYWWIINGAYVLVTTIMLLNLLIAMFSYRFQQIQEVADIHYRFDFYSMVFEYCEKPTTFQFVTYLIRCCRDDENKRATAKNEMHLKNVKLTRFIKLHTEKWLASESETKSATNNTDRRLVQLMEQLDDLRDEVCLRPSPPVPMISPPIDCIDGSQSPISTQDKINNNSHSLQAVQSELTRLESKLDKILKHICESKQ